MFWPRPNPVSSIPVENEESPVKCERQTGVATWLDERLSSDRVSYIIEPAAAAIEATGEPDVMPYKCAQMLREGKG